MGAIGGSELLIILVIVVVLFGASAIPKLAKSLGQAKREFEDGVDVANQASAKPRKVTPPAKPAADAAAEDDAKNQNQ